MISKNFKDAGSILLSNWKCKYVSLLLVHKQLSLDIIRSANEESDGTTSGFVKRKARIEDQLKVIEKANGINRRWKLTDPCARHSVGVVEKQIRDDVIMKLRSLAFDRWFLLSLKQKYSTGQKIAKVLSRNIDSKVANIRKVISSYNSRIAFKLRLTDFEQIRYTNAIDLQDMLYRDLPNLEGNDIPADMKRKVVELHTANKRAKEEVNLCEQDMRNIIEYILNERQNILSSIKTHECRAPSKFEIGAVSILTGKSSMLKKLLLHFRDSFVAVGVLKDTEYIIESSQEKDDNGDSVVPNFIDMDEILDDEIPPNETNYLSCTDSDDFNEDLDFSLHLSEDSD